MRAWFTPSVVDNASCKLDLDDVSDDRRDAFIEVGEGLQESSRAGSIPGTYSTGDGVEGGDAGADVSTGDGATFRGSN
jgi:hypothetical protein